MKNRKGKIISGIIIISLMIVAFFFFNNHKQNNLPSIPDHDMSVSQNVILNDTPPAKESNVKTLDIAPLKKGAISSEYEKDDKVPSDDVPQTSAISEEDVWGKDFTCILSVRCDTILNNISHLDKAKVDILPSDGIIFPEKSVVFYEGESVFNVLVREMKRNKIHMEFEMTPVYETAYIKGIANIYEFDCGELSGWRYKVNGKNPNVGCSLYRLKEGDKIEWIYTCG